MTYPSAPTDSGAPAFGLSEAVTLFTLIGAILTTFFGHDWGIAANAQPFAGLAVVLLPIGMGIARAIKHHGISRVQAQVLALQAAQILASVAQNPVALANAPTADPYPPSQPDDSYPVSPPDTSAPPDAVVSGGNVSVSSA